MHKILTHIFTLLYKIYCLIEIHNYESKSKIIPDTAETICKTLEPIQIDTNETYYGLTQHIRNLKTLTEEEILYIQTLPNENLIELILLYDKNSKFINENIMGL